MLMNKMWEIIVKNIIIFVIYSIFLIYLAYKWEDIYGTNFSIQCITIISLLGFLYVLFILNFSSMLENFIRGLSTENIKVYLPLIINIMIGFLGVIAIIISILYSTYITLETEYPGRNKRLLH